MSAVLNSGLSEYDSIWCALNCALSWPHLWQIKPSLAYTPKRHSLYAGCLRACSRSSLVIVESQQGLSGPLRCLRHPHDLVSPLIRRDDATIHKHPQSHKQRHITRPRLRFSIGSITTRLPKRKPLNSFFHAKHPHDLVLPRSKFPDGTSIKLPQSHKHCHIAALFVLRWFVGATAINLPNLTPVNSFN